MLEKIKKDERELLKFDPESPYEIIAKLSEIEGQEWKIRQEDQLNNDNNEGRYYTVRSAQVALKIIKERLDALVHELEIEEDPQERADILEEIGDLQSGRGKRVEIYGSGGVNRYFVMSNGEIAISEQHINFLRKVEILEKAKKLGLSVL